MSEKKLTALEKLELQHAQLTARLQAAKARQKNVDRKRDTRRKILVGSYYLEQAEKQNTMGEINNLMDKFLTRNSDRELFDLPLTSKK